MRSATVAALALAIVTSTAASTAHAQGDPSTVPQPAPGAPPAPGPPTQPQPEPDPWGGMNAGGLAPPAPLGQTAPAPPAGSGPGQGAPPPPTRPSMSGDLDDSREKDSGRGLSWFWIEVQGGYEHVGLKTFNVEDTEFAAVPDPSDLTPGVQIIETTSNGGTLSAGVGAQLVFLTLGVRGRMGFFEAWQIGRVGGELGFRIPLGVVEPRFDLGGGYAALGSFDSGVVPDVIGIDGGYARAGAGIDFYPVSILAIGAYASFDFLALKRAGISLAEIQNFEQSSGNALTDAQEKALLIDGAGYGAGFAIQGTVGLHF